MTWVCMNTCTHTRTHAHTVISKHETETRSVTLQPVFNWIFNEYVFSQGIKMYSKLQLSSDMVMGSLHARLCWDRNNTMTTCPLHEHISWCHALMLTVSFKTTERKLTKSTHSVLIIFTWNHHMKRELYTHAFRSRRWQVWQQCYKQCNNNKNNNDKNNNSIKAFHDHINIQCIGKYNPNRLFV